MTVHEPRRLIEQEDVLTGQERAELLGYADDVPGEKAQLRMLAKLQESMGADARVLSALPKRKVVVGWGLGALTLALLAGAALWVGWREPGRRAPLSAPQAVPASSREAPAQQAQGATQVEQPPLVTEEAPKKPDVAPRRSRAARSDTLEELKLLSRARRVLPTQPEAALRLTGEHAAAYPGGTFAEEREVLAIEALQRLERMKEAERRARAFVASYPSSSHGARLRAWLASPGPAR